MPRVRYGLPAAHDERMGTAMLPMPPATTAVYAYKEHVEGQPGTLAVPAPYPSTTSARPRDWFRAGPSESDAMPPEWYPSLYYEGAGAVPAYGIGGVAVFSDNLMPIPARDPRLLPAGIQGPVAQPGTRPAVSRPSRFIDGLGQRQVKWPWRGLRRWKDANKGPREN